MKPIFLIIIAFMLLACDSHDAFVNNEKYQLEIFPSPLSTHGGDSHSLIKGTTQEFKAVVYEEGVGNIDVTDKVKWISSSSDIIIMNNNVAEGLKVGRSEVSATMLYDNNNLESNTVAMEVIEENLTSIQITPPIVEIPIGNKQKMSAVGYYTNNTSRDITDVVIWTIQDDFIASFDKEESSVKGLHKGNTSIKAILENISSNSSDIEVTDAVIVSVQITPPAADIHKITFGAPIRSYLQESTDL